MRWGGELTMYARPAGVRAAGLARTDFWRTDLEPCGGCGGVGTTPRSGGRSVCEACDELGLPGAGTGPTKALPGTNERIAVMAARDRAGLPLWHPDDARADD